MNKIKIKREIEEEIELELPYYCKSICFYYKIVNENTVIQVLPKVDSDKNFEVNVVSLWPRLLDESHTQISSVEFDEVFQKTITDFMDLYKV